MIDPFNRRWHAASCSRVLAMTVGEAKWFAADRETLDAYLAARLARHATAKPVVACPKCSPEHREDARPRESTAAVASATIREEPTVSIHWCNNGFVVRTPLRVTFGPKRGSVERDVRARLREHLSELRVADGETLHAVFAGELPPNSDVENQLLYNVLETAGAKALLVNGVRFELDPAYRRSGFEYRYGSARRGADFTHWMPEIQAAAWDPQPFLRGSDDHLLARTWWSLRTAVMRTVDLLSPGARFGARVELRLPPDARDSAASTEQTKRLLDGLIASFQYHAASTESVARIARRVPCDESTVLANLNDRSRAVLGAAQRPIRVTSRDVQWNPDDRRLVAAEISVDDHPSPEWLIAGTLFGVAPKRPAEEHGGR